MKHEDEGHHQRIRNGHLVPVTCWCENTVVYTTVRNIRESITHSCGQSHCRSETA